MDHYLQLEMAGGADQPMLEGYTTLGFLAAHTRTVELQLLVTGVTYRRPGLLAKIVTTLDVLSGGRAALGLGAAWYAREHAALGVPFPPLAQRFERLEETLQIVHQMWSDDTGPFTGQHYQLAETLNVPQPLSRPHPPIMIGGGGEKKTLRLCARYADACNLFAGPQSGPAQVKAKLDVLAAHCARGGRRLPPHPQDNPVGQPARPRCRRQRLRRANAPVCRCRHRGGPRHAVHRRPSRIHRRPRPKRRGTSRQPVTTPATG
jgi:F420-dependent oxidoreductase-like protein